MSDRYIDRDKADPAVAPDSKGLAPTRDPLRKLGGRSFRAKFRSWKNSRFIKCESLLELKATQLFEVVSAIERYTEQPPPLRLKHDAGRPSSRYTPDFSIEWRYSAPWLVEVKPEEFASSEHWQSKFRAAALASIAKGYHFVVLTEEHIGAARINAVQGLVDERRLRHVMQLGEPQPEDDSGTEPGEVEHRVLRVLARALDRSHSMAVLRQLGLEDLDRPFAGGGIRAGRANQTVREAQCNVANPRRPHIDGGKA